MHKENYLIRIFIIKTHVKATVMQLYKFVWIS